MAIFNQTSQPSTTSKSKSIICSGTSITGEINVKCPLHIDGMFEGNIFSDSNLSIGQTGEVYGFVSANHVIVSGKFKGQIDCAVLEVLNSGEVNGDVNAKEMRLEAGGRFFGHSYDTHQKNFIKILPKEISEKLEDNQTVTLELESSKVIENK